MGYFLDDKRNNRNKVYFLIVLVVTITGSLVQSEEISPQVRIERVIPSKISYNLNEEADVSVWLNNTSLEVQTGTLVFREFYGIDESRNVKEIELTLQPNQERRDIVASYNVGQMMYGREIRVEFIQNGKIITSGSEFYSVANDWLRVNIISGWEPSDLGVFETYSNHAMIFSWAPCDFSDMIPGRDKWFSGQAASGFERTNFISWLNDFKSKGIRISTYAKDAFCGNRGFEFARQHPEWVVRAETGAFHTGYTRLSPVDLAKPITEKQPSYQAGIVDFYNTDAVEFGAYEIIRSIEMLGWDGIFFDGHFVVFPGHSWDGQPTPHGKNPNELSARNIKLCREIIRKKFPNIAIWYNTLNDEVISQPFKSVWGNWGGPETKKECLTDSNSGSLIEIQGISLFTPTSRLNNWRAIYDEFVAERNDAPQMFGSVLNCGWIWNWDLTREIGEDGMKKTRGAWATNNHLGALFLATQLHPCFNGASAMRPITQFMTRYSELLWAKDVKIIPNSTEILKITSTRPLWWQECVYQRKGANYVDYMIHLINVPESKTLELATKDDPLGAKGVVVELKEEVKKGVKIEAWALSPYDYYAKERVPVQVKLEPMTENSSILVKVPPFKYYTLVVVRFRK